MDTSHHSQTTTALRTSSVVSVAAAAASVSNKSSSSSGSDKAEVGIGVGAAAGAAVLLGIAFVVWNSKRKRHNSIEAPPKENLNTTRSSRDLYLADSRYRRLGYPPRELDSARRHSEPSDLPSFVRLQGPKTSPSVYELQESHLAGWA